MDVAVLDAPGPREDAQYRLGRDALAAAAFTHDGQGLAREHGQRHPVDSPDCALSDMEVGLEVPDFQQGLVGVHPNSSRAGGFPVPDARPP